MSCSSVSCEPCLALKRPKVYFYRNYLRFQGGHLKLSHYYRHVLESGRFQPMIYFTPESRLDDDNPFSDLKLYRLPQWKPEAADILFLAGMDWEALPENKRTSFPIPVINLIQGLRHADPGQPLYQFLSHRAVRICVSTEVRHAIESTGRVNGPVFTVPNGTDPSDLPQVLPYHKRPQNLLIIGMKRPENARDLSDRLNRQKITHTLLLQKLPRPQFLDFMAQSRIVVLLPYEKEGFYLPALEAMALGCMVICPDCIGNRSFCIDGHNAFRPAYNTGAILQSVKKALAMNENQRISMQRSAKAIVEAHSLEKEKKALLQILSNIHSLFFEGCPAKEPAREKGL